MKQKQKFDLEQFQINFSSLILTPFIEINDHLVPDIGKFPNYMNEVTNQSQKTAEGLNTYNRNYWYKLLSSLQTTLPLFSSLMGLWEFNKLSLRYFGRFKFSSRDLGDIPKNFFSELELDIASSQIGDLRTLLLQSLSLDLAWYQLFKCKASTEEKGSVAPSERSVFRLREQFCILNDSFGLWSKRFDLLAAKDEQGPSLQKIVSILKYEKRRTDEYYLLKSSELTVEKFSISPLEAQFLISLNQRSLADGILKFSQLLSASDLKIAEGSLHHWIKLSLERNMWQIEEAIHV